MPSKHALLSASAAHRWLECPPSARLCEHMPDETSIYAEEGTLAHQICEEKLLVLKGDLAAVKTEPKDAEMQRCTDLYRDFVEEEWNAAKAKTKDAALFVEQELQFGEYVPEGFGTSDAVIVSDDTLEVIDFKYGKGVPVDATNNPQLRLYALGAYAALSALYDFKYVVTAVVQPRIDRTGSEKLTVEELLTWAEEYVKPRAKLAYEGEGEFKVGDHCRFCKAGATCRARVEDAFKIIDLSETQPATIGDDEVPDILDKLDNAEKWIESMRQYAERRALEGMKWRGYKVVEARTQRKIINQLEALSVLEEAGYSQEDVTTVKLKGIGELEKLLGKSDFKELLSGFVVKPQGAPTLVKETDKRPEFNPVEEAFKEEI